MMAEDAQSITALQSTTHIPIAQLTPLLVDPGKRSVKAVVTLTWPYSSVTKSIAFLLAEPDFRLRHTKGQVRVQFGGSSARSIASSGIASGDEVLLGLDGVEFIHDETVVSTPGRSVGFELKFSERLILEFQQEGSEKPISIDIDHPEVHSEQTITEESTRAKTPDLFIHTPIIPNTITPRRPDITLADDEFSSPAFIKRARTSYGSLWSDDFELEDGTVNGKGRKRSRMSSTWTFNSRSPTPDMLAEENNGFLTPAPPMSRGLDKFSTTVDEAIQTDNIEDDIPETLLAFARQSMAQLDDMRSPTIPDRQSQLPDGQQLPLIVTDMAVLDEQPPTSPRLQPLPSENLPLVSPLISRGLGGLPQVYDLGNVLEQSSDPGDHTKTQDPSKKERALESENEMHSVTPFRRGESIPQPGTEGLDYADTASKTQIMSGNAIGFHLEDQYGRWQGEGAHSMYGVSLVAEYEAIQDHADDGTSETRKFLNHIGEGQSKPSDISVEGYSYPDPDDVFSVTRQARPWEPESPQTHPAPEAHGENLDQPVPRLSRPKSRDPSQSTGAPSVAVDLTESDSDDEEALTQQSPPIASIGHSLSTTRTEETIRREYSAEVERAEDNVEDEDDEEEETGDRGMVEGSDGEVDEAHGSDEEAEYEEDDYPDDDDDICDDPEPGIPEQEPQHFVRYTGLVRAQEADEIDQESSASEADQSMDEEGHYENDEQIESQGEPYYTSPSENGDLDEDDEDGDGSEESYDEADVHPSFSRSSRPQETVVIDLLSSDDEDDASMSKQSIPSGVTEALPVYGHSIEEDSRSSDRLGVESPYTYNAKISVDEIASNLSESNQDSIPDIGKPILAKKTWEETEGDETDLNDERHDEGRFERSDKQDAGMEHSMPSREAMDSTELDLTLSVGQKNCLDVSLVREHSAVPSTDAYAFKTDDIKQDHNQDGQPLNAVKADKHDRRLSLSSFPQSQTLPQQVIRGVGFSFGSDDPAIEDNQNRRVRDLTLTTSNITSQDNGISSKTASSEQHSLFSRMFGLDGVNDEVAEAVVYPQLPEISLPDSTPNNESLDKMFQPAFLPTPDDTQVTNNAAGSSFDSKSLYPQVDRAHSIAEGAAAGQAKHLPLGKDKSHIFNATPKKSDDSAMESMSTDALRSAKKLDPIYRTDNIFESVPEQTIGQTGEVNEHLVRRSDRVAHGGDAPEPLAESPRRSHRKTRSTSKALDEETKPPVSPKTSNSRHQKRSTTPNFDVNEIVSTSSPKNDENRINIQSSAFTANNNKANLHKVGPVTPKKLRRGSLRGSLEGQQSSPTVIADKRISPRGHDASIELALSSLNSPEHDLRRTPILDLKLRLNRNLRTELEEFKSLKILRYELNRKLDVLAITTTSPPAPERAKSGPRHYVIIFNVTDPSVAPSGVTEVQIFRPYKEALPTIEVGDGILLRNFQVISLKNKGFGLRSDLESSSWAVFKQGDEVEVKGPPVEYGAGEKNHITQMKVWYENLDSDSIEKLRRANGGKT